jgi:hypothetical protein
MPAELYWIDAIARQRGLRYEPDADERWLRAWEPYSTVKVPLRYEHAVHATGGTGSLSIARAVLELPSPPAPPGQPVIRSEVGTWIAIVQDVRITGAAAATNDFGSPFAESLDLIPVRRMATGDSAFDHSFAAFAASETELAQTISPSLRKLLLSWRVPVHAELRPGGFIIAPVSVPADDRGLSWILDAIVLFGQKATKART